MNLKVSLNRHGGFTIIEVLIVLAIAGLIMLVVFLAVPNVQRNSRNNDRRNEVARLIAAYHEASSNKNGAVLAASWSDNTSLGDGSVDSQSVLQAAHTTTISYLSINPYYSGPITYQNITFASNNRVSPKGALIRTGSKCAGPTDGTATPGSPSQIAVYFSIESSANPLQCVDG